MRNTEGPARLAWTFSATAALTGEEGFQLEPSSRDGQHHAKDVVGVEGCWSGCGGIMAVVAVMCWRWLWWCDGGGCGGVMEVVVVV